MQKVTFQVKKNFMEKVHLRKYLKHASDEGFDKSTNKVKKKLTICCMVKNTHFLNHINLSFCLANSNRMAVPLHC